MFRRRGRWASIWFRGTHEPFCARRLCLAIENTAGPCATSSPGQKQERHESRTAPVQRQSVSRKRRLPAPTLPERQRLWANNALRMKIQFPVTSSAAGVCATPATETANSRTGDKSSLGRSRPFGLNLCGAERRQDALLVRLAQMARWLSPARSLCAAHQPSRSLPSPCG